MSPMFVKDFLNYFFFFFSLFFFSVLGGKHSLLMKMA